MLCFECKKRNAGSVIGIDLQTNRLEQARTLAEIMGLSIQFREIDLFCAAELGQFDLVFCIAVVTEITDLIRALEVLRKVTKDVLYLELAIMETFPISRRVLGISLNTLLEMNLNTILGYLAPRRFGTVFGGTAKLRGIRSKLKTGWSLVPDSQFLISIMGDQFEITDMGMSARYNLFKLTRK